MAAQTVALSGPGTSDVITLELNKWFGACGFIIVFDADAVGTVSIQLSGDGAHWHEEVALSNGDLGKHWCGNVLFKCARMVASELSGGEVTMSIIQEDGRYHMGA